MKRRALWAIGVLALAALVAWAVWQTVGPRPRPSEASLVVGQWYEWDGRIGWDSTDLMLGSGGIILMVDGWRIQGSDLPTHLPLNTLVHVRGRFAGSWIGRGICGYKAKAGVEPEPSGSPCFADCTLKW